MGTFRINPANKVMFIHFIRQTQNNCVNLFTKLLTTMVWAIVVIAIMIVFGLMLFAKIMAT